MEKRGQYLKRIFAMLSLIFLLIPLISAADVAYIYRKEFRIDDNIVETFENMGLSVDLINENNLPSNFNNYKLIFAGDENFRKEFQIPINSFPSIVANYYHADSWGLTDAEGVSQLAANSPLKVQKDHRIIQVYTDWRNDRRIAIPYYFLDMENRAEDLISIATTVPSASGDDYGDVISYAYPGAQMYNGKTQQAKLCFFGIIESDYWTQSAKNMFEECIDFVAASCSSDSNCPSDTISEPFCGEDENVHRTTTSYSCQNPGEASAQCISQDDSTLIEECSFGCELGACLPGPHDVALIDFSNSIDKIKITDLEDNPILNSELTCNQEYKIIVAAENQGYHTENVTLSGSIDNIPISYSDILNLQPNEIITRTAQINTPSNEGTYIIEVEASIPEDESQGNNFAEREITISCPVIICRNDSDCDDDNSTTLDTCHNSNTEESFCTNDPIRCSSNSECGEDRFLDAPYCSDSGNSVQDYITFTCNDAGLPSSYCSNRTDTNTLSICPDTCINGECIGIPCDDDLDCEDQNPLTLDKCINPGFSISECRNTPINCASDGDCRFTGFFGEEFCSQENAISKNYQTSICNNPGTLESSCDMQIISQIINQCPFACTEGTCINCDAHEDCVDDNINTQDLCVNAGTLESYCSNPPINQDEIVCSSDTDCKATSTLSDPFCSSDNINKLVRKWSCVNEGTTLSYCSSKVEQELIRSCPAYCSEAECIEIMCFTHSDCEDNDPVTLDLCNNPGTKESFCTNNPKNITCSSDLDCGTDGYLAEDICFDKNITDIYQEFTCHNPGESISYCSMRAFQETTEVCDFFCSDGECRNTPPTEPVCGNGELEEGEECDDGNLFNGDSCSSNCKIEIPTECSPGETRICGTNVGECETGTETCSANGLWGACQGKISPLEEICDNKDNNCNGEIDENNICEPSCTNECSPINSQMCLGDTGYSICGNFDEDNCLEWSSINACPTSYSCRLGECIQQSCTNECTDGARQCSGSSGFKICRDYNGDGCTEWSQKLLCDQTESCQGGYCE